MKLNIPPLGQRDPRWSAKRLGGDGTIGRYGCLLVCHSMALQYYGHEGMTPDVLNQVFKEKGAYDGNYLNFYAVGNVFTDYKAEEMYQCPDVACDMSKVDSKLNEKKPVIALVDFDNNPVGGVDSHFVLIIGKDESGNYFINDPWEGETYYFHAKYGEPSRGIYGLRIYSGTPKNGESLEDKVNDLTDKLKTCNSMVAEKSLEVNDLRDALQEQEKENEDLANQLLTARGERDKAVWEQERLQLENKSLKEKIQSLESDKKLLQENLSKLKEQTVLDWSSLSLIWEGIKKIFKRG